MSLPCAFLSYVRDVDKHDGKALSFLRDRLAGEFNALSGEKIQIFQDWKDIGWGEDWRKRIHSELKKGMLFIPVLTEGYFVSPICREEFELFAEREKALKRSDLILPILYIDCPILRDRTNKDPIVEIIRQRNYADWTNVRNKPRSSQQYINAITHLANQLMVSVKRTKHIRRSTNIPKRHASVEIKFISPRLMDFRTICDPRISTADQILAADVVLSVEPLTYEHVYEQKGKVRVITEKATLQLDDNFHEFRWFQFVDIGAGNGRGWLGRMGAAEPFVIEQGSVMSHTTQFKPSSRFRWIDFLNCVCSAKQMHLLLRANLSGPERPQHPQNFIEMTCLARISDAQELIREFRNTHNRCPSYFHVYIDTR